MKYTYLHDLSLIQVGKKYHFRLMPDNRSVTGTVILVEVSPEDTSKGKIHTENNADRFYVGEYQYIQYSEVSDETKLSDVFSNIDTVIEFANIMYSVGDSDGSQDRSREHRTKNINEAIVDFLEEKGIKNVRKSII